MKKISEKELPALRNASKFPVKVIDASALKNAGINATYGIRPGDVVEFPDTFEDAHIIEQEVRAGGPTQQLVAVLRNAKPSYFSIGSLRKVDASMKGTCDFTNKMFTQYHDDNQRLSAVLGKTIKCDSQVEIELNEFTRDGEQTGKKVMRKAPVIEFVNAK